MTFPIHAAVYLLPVVLKHFPESLQPLLNRVQLFATPSGDAALSISETGKIRGVLSLLKSARQLGLVSGVSLASNSNELLSENSKFEVGIYFAMVVSLFNL